MKHERKETLWPAAGADMGILFALVLSVVLTAVVLIAPERNWGPEMWPVYLGAAAALVWAAVDLWVKLRHDADGNDGAASKGDDPGS
jgi:hypothetical protein